MTSQKNVSIKEIQFRHTYKTAIQKQMAKMNSIQDYSDTDYKVSLKALLKEIKYLDQQFIEGTEAKVVGNILFSRHGKCSQWTQKKFGLNPNAALSEEAERNMSVTNQYTIDLLVYQNHASLYMVSPLVRARQTASLLIPIDHKNSQVIIEPALSENSDAPSGNNLRNYNDLKQDYTNGSLFKTPLRAILFKLSIWFYKNKDVFLHLENKSDNANKTMNGLVDKFTNDTKETHPEKSLNKNEKIQVMHKLINDHQGDLWFFGHGKNFKSFFSSTFGISSTFEYGETRRIYCLQIVDTPSLFSPPYTFIIDQDTGRIRGRYIENNFAVVTAPIHQNQA